MSFEEAVKEYLNFVEKRQKKQSFDTVLKDFNSRILPYFENTYIIELNNKTITNWYEEIESHNFSNKYNHKLYYTFSSFLDYCTNKKYIECNFLKDIGPFKKHYEPDKHDFYTLDEFNLFITGFDKKNFIYRIFFEFMFFTGTRPSEAMALNFSDLQGNYIFIRKNIQRHGNREIDTPKTISSIRKILIDKKMLKELLYLKSYYEKNITVLVIILYLEVLNLFLVLQLIDIKI